MSLILVLVAVEVEVAVLMPALGVSLVLDW